MYWNVTMEYSEERGTWNVIADGEWYFEGTYEQCCEVMDNMLCEEDEYYEEEYDYADDYDLNAPCDNFGLCAGTDCPHFYKCQA